jgi:putative tryptophan/tyrosine transport system substrate-binding protein
MGRREFITLLGGATSWPLAVHAQTERMRRIGVLMAYPEADLEAKALVAEFTRSLAALGWKEGGNLRMDLRWASSNLESMRIFAKELVDLQPDAILANSTPVTAAVQHETQTIPIVFAINGDPVGLGLCSQPIASRPKHHWVGYV